MQNKHKTDWRKKLSSWCPSKHHLHARAATFHSFFLSLSDTHHTRSLCLDVSIRAVFPGQNFHFSFPLLIARQQAHGLFFFSLSLYFCYTLSLSLSLFRLSTMSSVTRFGAILPLLQKIISLFQFLTVYLVFC